jgi:hypothetical protein
MAKTVVITTNLGNFDKQVDPVSQSVKYDFFRFTDDNFPPRLNSMTPRLQARIPKCYSWQMVPDYNYYIWVDSSCSLSHPDSVRWFLKQCENTDFAFFKHPNRNSIQEEADYLKLRLENGCSYITPRYENELIDEQLKAIRDDKDFVDDKLFASTAFIYKNSGRTHGMLSHWWHHISRYHSIDQLSLPYVLWKSKCSFKTILESYLKVPYLQYTRK